MADDYCMGPSGFKSLGYSPRPLRSVGTEVVRGTLVSELSRLLQEAVFEDSSGVSSLTSFSSMLRALRSYRKWSLYSCAWKGRSQEADRRKAGGMGHILCRCGLGMDLTDGALGGILRVTTRTPKRREHVREKDRIPSRVLDTTYFFAASIAQRRVPSTQASPQLPPAAATLPPSFRKSPGPRGGHRPG